MQLVILPLRTQQLLIKHCLDVLVYLCYCLTSVNITFETPNSRNLEQEQANRSWQQPITKISPVEFGWLERAVFGLHQGGFLLEKAV